MPKGKECSVFQKANLAIWILLATLFVLLCLRESSSAHSFLILGRYSSAYAAVLGVYALGLLVYGLLIVYAAPLLRNLLLISLPMGLFTLGLSNVALEFMSRWGLVDSFKANVLDFYQASDLTSFEFRKNYRSYWYSPEFNTTISTNDFGIRDSRAMADILQKPKQVMCIGDSFTLGLGVKQGRKFSDILEKEHFAEDVASYSVAYAAGRSPVDYEAFLRVYAQELKPGMVILGLFMQNDLHADPAATDIQYNAQGQIVRTSLKNAKVLDGYIVHNAAGQKRLSFRRKLHGEFWQRLILYRMVHRAFKLFSASIYPLEQTFDPVEALPDFFRANYAPSKHYQASLEALRRISVLLQEQSIPLLLVLIPSRFQVSERYCSLQLKEHPHYEQFVSGRYPQESLLAWADEQEILCLDLSDHLRQQEAKGSAMYFQVDAHWNEQGHAQAAAAIAQFLKTHTDKHFWREQHV